MKTTATKPTQPINRPALEDDKDALLYQPEDKEAVVRKEGERMKIGGFDL